MLPVHTVPKRNMAFRCMTVFAAAFVLLGLTAYTHVHAVTTLTFLHHLEAALAKDLDELLMDIGSRYDAEIDMIFTTDRLLVERAFVLASAGVMPDIIRVDQQQIRALATAGLLEDLTPYLERDGINLEDDFIPLTAEAFAYKGQQFAIPAEVSSHATFYLTSLFDEAGLPRPTADWSSSEWDWDDLVTAGERITQDPVGAGGPVIYGINPLGHVYFYPWLWGADWSDEHASEFYGARPDVVAALERVADLNRRGLVGGNIVRGTAAVRITGSWVLDQFRTFDDLEWDLGVFPKGTERTVGILPNGFAISKTSQNKELAWEIIKALTLEDSGVQRYTDIVTRIPSHRDHWDYYLESQEKFFPGKKNTVFLEALHWGKIWTIRFNPNWPNVDPIIRNAWDQAWRGEKPVAQAMAEITPQVNALLKEGLELAEQAF